MRALSMEILRLVLANALNRDHILSMDGTAPLVDCVAHAMDELRHAGGAAVVNAGLKLDGAQERSRKEEGLGLVKVEVEVEVKELLCSGLDTLSMLVRHVPMRGSLIRVQEESVNYLLAKGLLPDLSHLLCRLHPLCEAIVHTCSSTMRGNVLALVGHVVGLLDAITSFPICSRVMTTESHGAPATSEVGTREEGSVKETEVPQTSQSSWRAPALSGWGGENAEGVGEPVKVCWRLEDLHKGQVALRPVFAAMVANNIFSARAVSSPVSLLAALAMAEGGIANQSSANQSRKHQRSARVDGATCYERDVVPPLSDELLALAAVVVHEVNKVAMLNLGMMQEAISMEGVGPEFSYLCDRLLASISNRLEYQGSERKHKIAEAEDWLAGLVRLMGYFSLCCAKNQELLGQRGSSPTLLVQLCNLPFRYFAEPVYQDILFPTLISICFRNDQNRDIVENDLAMELLASYLKQYTREYKLDNKKHGQLEGNFTPTPGKSPPPWVMLSWRLPVSMWQEAGEWFDNPL
ncbi:unnamed protein product [Discosporangium mesarthrocarpum]